MDAWWFDESQARQDAVRGLFAHLHASQDDRTPLVVCGDFNADPDSDELRMMTGRAAAPVKGLSFYDGGKSQAQVAGAARGPTPTPSPPNCCGRIVGSTTSSQPPPRRGGAGHPLAAGLLGAGPRGGTYASEHYAVQADIRY